MLTLPDVRQADDYDCGWAAVDAVAQYWGKRTRGPAKLANRVQGMQPDTVEAVLRSLGFSVLSGTMYVGLLRELTAAGNPVLCPITLATEGGPVGHWVVVRGVARGRVHYHCPAAGPKATSYTKWVDAWRDSHRVSQFDRWGVCPMPVG